MVKGVCTNGTWSYVIIRPRRSMAFFLFDLYLFDK